LGQRGRQFHNSPRAQSCLATPLRHTAPLLCSPLAASPIPQLVNTSSVYSSVYHFTELLQSTCAIGGSFLRVWATSTITWKDRSPGAEDEDALRRSCFLCHQSWLLEQSPFCYSSCWLSGL